MKFTTDFPFRVQSYSISTKKTITFVSLSLLFVIN